MDRHSFLIHPPQDAAWWSVSDALPLTAEQECEFVDVYGADPMFEITATPQDSTHDVTYTLHGG